MARAPLHLVAYDISDNKARRAISSRLEDVGVRVQGSVFEIRLSAARLDKLLEGLRPMCGARDSLRAYPIPERAAARTRVIGTGAPPPVGSHWIL